MKIHILTGHFHPQVHPRAFRSHELATELVRQGHDVTVTSLTTIRGFDYEAYSRQTGVRVRLMGLYEETLQKSRGRNSAAGISWAGRLYRFLLTYLLDGATLFRARAIARRLQIEPDTQLVIALSTPFMCQYGLSLYMRSHAHSFVAVADSGDPFYLSRQNRRAPWFRGIEQRVYQTFRFLCIPTEAALPAYKGLLPPEKIRIIPQGFRMDHLPQGHVPRQGPVRFAYAGVFYWDIRNPEFLFRYLDGVEQPFEFHIYMRFQDALVDSLLERYSHLRNRVVMHYAVPHDNLLVELCSMHFLLNIENAHSTQLPSKLIDYGMAGRPIFSCNEGNFRPEHLHAFLLGQYEGALHVDIAQYDIRRIASQFLSLATEGL